MAEDLDRAADRLRAAARASDEAARAGQELARQLDRIDAAMERLAAAGDGERTGAAKGGDGERAGATEGGGLESLGAALVRQLSESADLTERARAVRPSLVEDVRRWAEHAFSRAAPGTEAFKQDLAEWASLRDELRLAVGRFAGLDVAVEGARGDDLHVGSGERIPESYRRLVERYYRSLAEQRP